MTQRQGLQAGMRSKFKSYIDIFFKKWTGHLLFLPTVLVLGILVLLPILEAIRWAFTDMNLMRSITTYIGLRNFLDMTADSTFWTALKNSVLLTTIVILLQYTLGLGLAVALKQKVPGIGIFRSVVMASWVIPVISTVIMFRFMAQPDYGFFNMLLEKIG